MNDTGCGACGQVNSFPKTIVLTELMEQCYCLICLNCGSVSTAQTIKVMVSLLTRTQCLHCQRKRLQMSSADHPPASRASSHLLAIDMAAHWSGVSYLVAGEPRGLRSDRVRCLLQAHRSGGRRLTLYPVGQASKASEGGHELCVTWQRKVP